MNNDIKKGLWIGLLLAVSVFAGIAAINDEGIRIWKSIIVDGTTGKQAQVERNGGLAVNVQDQATQTIDAYFAQSTNTFNIASNVTASTVTNLVYTFVASNGHSIVVNDEVLLLDTTADRSFYAEVTGVSGDNITLDRPIDHAFTTNALGRLVITDMAVDGSTTPQIFSVRSGVTETDITRFILSMTFGSSGDDGKFGDQTALSNGLVLRILNSFQETIFNFDTNGDIGNFCYDTQYNDKAPGGTYGFNARITFGGQSKHGVVLRIGENDVLQWIVQDDLTGLNSFKIVAQGHKVTD